MVEAYITKLSSELLGINSARVEAELGKNSSLINAFTDGTGPRRIRASPYSILHGAELYPLLSTSAAT